mmetsp:Transcript_7354/g.8311  ORF Transcript_7354/g.8311 Transcript_7354/m.8311 type:complete len:147 (-) Transcript_7354:143-583(-)
MMNIEDDMKFAIVLLVGNLLFVCMIFYSFINLVTMFALYFLIAAIGLGVINKATNNESEDKTIEKPENLKYEFVNGETIQALYIGTYVGINNGIQYIQEVISLKNKAKTFKTLLILLVLSSLTSWLSDFTFLWLSFNSMLIFSKLY